MILFIFCFCGCHQEADLNDAKIVYSEISKISIFKGIPSNKIAIERIGGWSNFTYLITLPKKVRFVLRMPKKGASKLKGLLKINTYNEYANSNHAYLLEISAKIEFFDPTRDIFLLKYVENKKTLEGVDFHDAEILKDVARILNKLHSSKTMFNNDVNIFLALERLADYFSVTYQDKIPKDLGGLLSVVKKAQLVFRDLNVPKVPCHGDSNPGNFLLTDKGVILVDWEYSGNDDPAWDLALLSVTAEFNHEQDRLMINAYGNKEDKLLLERVIIYKPLVQLWRFFWVGFQAFNGDDEDEKQRFLKMSELRYDDCKKILLSKEFKNSLARLAKQKSKVIH